MTTPSDMFRDSVFSLLNGINTSQPGIVVSFDPSTNKANIQPALNKAFLSGEMAQPILSNVPIMFPQNITFPINIGDYVLLIFSQRSLDLWLSVGGRVTPNDPRKFDLSDAIAIPGLKPFNSDFSANNGTDFKISFAGSEIKILANGNIEIKTSNKVAIGKSTAELLDLFDKLLDSIIANLANAPPYPVVVSDAVAIKVLLATIKGTIT